MSSRDLEQAILAHVSSSGYQPAKPRMIAMALGLSSELGREVKRAIKSLVKRGRLVYGSNHLVGLPHQIDSDGLVGIFRRMSAGYGFVRPSAKTVIHGTREDIYVSAKNAGDASTGDTVLVRLHPRRPQGRQLGPSGLIVRVLERETHRFVGVYFEQGGLSLVDVDGKLFKQPVLVGDPGTKGARPDDKVVLEMVRFPSHVHDGEGVIVEVLGPRGAPGVDTLSIIHEFSLPVEFAEDALAVARREAESFDESIGNGRVDLTGETVITIDPVDARDFDDAISLETLKGGHWLLGVHIADVSHFVRARSALDREARDRATSVYLPDRVLPMLPEIISNNLASLQPDRVRYTMSALMEFTGDGTAVHAELQKAAIQSRRRFTYEEVDQYLARPVAWRKKLSPEVHALLGRMHKLAMILRHRRRQRGALELVMPDVQLDLDQDGQVVGAHVEQQTESHQIIEEFMLAANEAVAQLLDRHELLFLRRVHAAPDPRKLKALTDFVTELGFKTENLENRFAIQELLDQVRTLPQRHAVNFAVLRSLQKAIYSPDRDGHYALASDCYCHFTSPIRRYPDLTVHRLVNALLAGKKVAQDGAELVALGEHCSEREQRAEESERELIKVKLLNYLSQRIGQEMDGIITGVEEYGLYIQGVELPAEGLVHVSSLADDYYRFDRSTHTLAGYRSGNSYRLGDAVRVSVVHVDVGRRELDFRLLSRATERAKGVRRGAKGEGRAAKGVRRGAKGEGRAAKGVGRGVKSGGRGAKGVGRGVKSGGRGAKGGGRGAKGGGAKGETSAQ